MKKILLSIFSIFLLYLPFIGIINSANDAEIDVYVQTSQGERVQAIEITLTGPSSYSQTKNTDSSGKAAFTALADGDYTATINLLAGGDYELVAGETKTKTRTVTSGTVEEVYFGVKTKTSDETDGETNIKPEIPSSFYASGSTTTVVKDLTTEQLKSISNFTLDTPGFSKIVFNEKVDLSSQDTLQRLAKLNQYVFMDQKGEVTIASDLMPELNKKATVTLYSLSFVSLGSDYTPVILKDDFEPSGSEVTNVTLTGKDKITFDVSGFSTYAVRPTLIFEEKNIDTDQQKYTLTGKIDDLDAEISVFLNNSRIEQDITPDSEGNFSVELELKKGENNVQVTAKGVSEQSYGEALTINYGSNEKNPVSSTNWSLIIGIVLLAGAVLGGGFYYYKTKYLPRRRSKQQVKSFDQRLLTDEERIVFKNENGQKEQDQK